MTELAIVITGMILFLAWLAVIILAQRGLRELESRQRARARELKQREREAGISQE